MCSWDARATSSAQIGKIRTEISSTVDFGNVEAVNNLSLGVNIAYRFNFQRARGTAVQICTIDGNKNGIESMNKEYSDPLTLALDGYSLTLVTIPF
jgi:hypothetical protein